MRIFFAAVCFGLLVLTATNVQAGQGARRAPQPKATPARSTQPATAKPVGGNARGPIATRSRADLNRDGKVSEAERARTEHLRSVAPQTTDVPSRGAERAADERRLGSSTRIAALQGRSRASKRG